MSKSCSKHVLLIAIIVLHKVARTQVRCPFTQNLKLFMTLLKLDSSFKNCGDLSSYRVRSASGLPNLDQLSLMCQSDECTAMIQRLRAMNPPNCSAYLPWKFNRINLLAFTAQYDAVCARIRDEDDKKIKAQAALLILTQLSDMNMSTLINSTALVNATVLEAPKSTKSLPKARPVQQKIAPMEASNANSQD